MKDVYVKHIADIIRDYNYNTHGHFFDHSTMQAFKCKLYDVVYLSADQKYGYFVTSEKGPNMKRLYTVRIINLSTYGIGSIPKFQAFTTLKTAERMARYYAECHT